MQRRSFLTALGAFGLAPAMPFQAMISSSATVAASSPLYNHHMFGHALAMVRSRGSVSIGDFQKAMHLTAPQAQAIIREFARDGYISGGFSATGVLNAIQPTWTNWGASGLQSPVQTVAKSLDLDRLKPKLDIEDLLQDEAENPDHEFDLEPNEINAQA